MIPAGNPPCPRPLERRQAMKVTLAIAFAAMTLTVCGCASVPMGDAKQDATLKTFSIPSNKAGIYIYRNEAIGAGVKMDVQIDGAPIGQTAANTYLFREVAPGSHTVSSTAENTDVLQVDAKAGTLVYIWQEVKMGVLYARNKLHLMGEALGRKGVLETKLAQTR